MRTVLYIIYLYLGIDFLPNQTKPRRALCCPLRPSVTHGDHN